MPASKGEDRALGVNISMPNSLFKKIDTIRGSKSRSAYVREIIIPVIEAKYEEHLRVQNRAVGEEGRTTGS